MNPQTTLGTCVTLDGIGLHTGRRSAVTLHPAAPDHGRRLAVGEGLTVPLTWPHWTPSRMSTSIEIGGGRTVRTTEHMLAALFAHGIDNVRIEVDGPEIPIFDGSAEPWCACLRRAGTTTLAVPRRAIRVVAPVQVARDGGMLRVEPALRFEVDVTHDLLPAFPTMRWHGPVEADLFDAEIARARSFGNLHRRLGLTPPHVSRPASNPPVTPHAADPALCLDEARWTEIATRHLALPADPRLLRGWRPWRATVIFGRHILPWPRFPDEPVRHVVLDMIGDLALAGAPLVGRVVAHNPSHEKTYALVAELMSKPDCWTID